MTMDESTCRNSTEPLPLAPCPYHREKQPCGKEKLCPLLAYEKTVGCTMLTPGRILMVRAWVTGES
jgi:hypothetical protein